ncbi:uncharacterized protein LOC120249350 [Dioscorea cayenensis subsp. rotundata]|uniref:Uncharacterized protein LOC120249350 n=1 Tax=Dioscorea cayennensis subsp. rotundata TaxID=55577 RepID=A0AB40AFU9_DIOCR|nr:uncharacterized protein LOC120249350 [Dioscorea cayenensis subsp. rotundata]
MIPPEPITRRKGRKTLLRRREIGEDERGFTNGRVKKTGVTMKCSICGAPGHNKRHHQRPQGEPSSEAGQHNPMDDIDPHILEEHFALVDAMYGPSQSAATTQTQPSVDPSSQVINPPQQGFPTTQTGTQSGMKMHKLPAWGGKGFDAATNIAKTQYKDKGTDRRSKEGTLTRRKKAWLVVVCSVLE